MSGPSSWGEVPISAPIWLWVAYAALMVTLGALTGSFFGSMMVCAAAGFSFQFWTFAVWRGLSRTAAAEDSP